MAGRITKSDEQLRPDPRFQNKTLAKFTNCIMVDGKKAVAERVIYDAMDEIQRRLPVRNTGGSVAELFERTHHHRPSRGRVIRHQHM